MNKRGSVVAVTGVSGYLGARLAELLNDDERVDRIVGVDCQAPPSTPGKMRFYQRDINAPDLAEIFARESVTHVAHLAFLLAPNHDRRRTTRINVGGTQNVLSAAATDDVQQIVFASSSVVYGAHSDNPHPIPEAARFRPSRQVQYTQDKVEAEGMCERFRSEHPDKKLAVLRVVTIVGPGTDNFITRFLARPLLIVPRGFDPPWQFVHELDCARAFHTALFGGRSGAFNLGADDPVRLSEVIAELGKPVLRVPRGLLKCATNLAWYARLKWLTEIPGDLIEYLCHPPVLANQRLKEEFDFQFQYSSREAIATYLDDPSGGQRPGETGSAPASQLHLAASLQEVD